MTFLRQQTGEVPRFNQSVSTSPPNNEIYKRARCHSGLFSFFKDGGRLYGFAKPTGPPSTEFFTWECVSVAILHSVFIRPALITSSPLIKRGEEVKRLKSEEGANPAGEVLIAGVHEHTTRAIEVHFHSVAGTPL